MQIRAALSTSADAELTVSDVELAEPRAGEVLVRLVASGICHTDLVTKSFWPAQLSPMVFGHEGAGVVEAVGPDVREVSVGDHVVMSFRRCGACGSCTAGHPAYCEQFQLLNASGGRGDGTSALSRNGAPVFAGFFGQSSFASHTVTGTDNLVVVPSDVDLAVAAPFGCSIQTGAGAVLNVLQPGSGDALAVYGVGAVGLAAVMASVAGNVRTVAVDPLADRRALALEFGASAAIDPEEGDVVAAVVEATDGGATAAIDTTAIPDVINSGIGALRARGTLALVGIGNPELKLSAPDLLSKGRSVTGVIEGDADPKVFVPQLLAMHTKGTLPVDKIVANYPFEEIAQAFADAATGKVIKPVLRFGEA